MKKYINVSEDTYKKLQKEANKFACGNIEKYLDNLEPDEIQPEDDKEEKEWKDKLYNMLTFLATERPDLRPKKRDDLNTLTESFCFWASEYNGGFFEERADAPNDRFAAWLVQEYDSYEVEPYNGSVV